jgi:hypothetical protein
MGIFQPIPVFSDVKPTFCGFSVPKTIWANGDHNFELVAGKTHFDTGDATAPCRLDTHFARLGTQTTLSLPRTQWFTASKRC